tara:strand:+ start:70547 stop:71545 length:999 start_codon:yes stop_codon:yes gene_type:complete
MQPTLQRLTFIDAARTYAVFLALLAHAFITTGLFNQLGEASIYIKQFTRVATPIFVFMFGFMVEFVYAKKTRELGGKAVKQRLLARSFQCYLAYVLTSFCGFLGGYYSEGNFIYSLFFFGDARFGNILRVYAVLLLLVPVIIRLRIRLGTGFILISYVCVVLSFNLLEETRNLSFGFLDHPLNVFFGAGPVKGGPSIWHSLSFLLAGMFIASSLECISNKSNNQFYTYCLYLLACSLILALFLIQESPSEAWTKFADMSYRLHNMAGYYLIGVVCSVITLAVFSVVIGKKPLPKWANILMPMGYSSLFSYTFGNCLLNLFGGISTQIPSLVF